MTYTEKLWAIRTPDGRWRASVYTRGNLSWLNTWPAVKHRKRENLRGGTEFYAWLKRKGFPKGFRVLCHKKDAKLSSCKGDRIVVRVTATYEVEE